MFEEIYANSGTIIMLAVFIEALIEIYKKGLPKLLNFIPAEALSAILGVIHCVVLDIKLFTPVNSNVVTDMLAYLLTGLVVSRGANFIHNLIDLLKKNKPA